MAAAYTGPTGELEFHRVTRRTDLEIRSGIVALLALGTSLMAPSAVHAAGVATPPAPNSQGVATIDDREIAELVRFRIEKQRRATAAVVGVLRPSGRSIIAYQSTRGPHAFEPGGDTIFEIASLTKVFTALLLADAVTRNEVRFDDPLSKIIPAGTTVPEYAGHVITLVDLATHTSGLPLRPANLRALPDASNKYAGYTLDQLYDGLAAIRLARDPGVQFEYSNLGFALLGQGLARHAGLPFADLLSDRIATPLGLSDTRFDDDPAARARRAQGHDVDLNPIGPSGDGALSPAGGLRSTADDLLRFLELFVHSAGPGRLSGAARAMLEVDRPGEAPDTRMALGWRKTTARGETYYWSNGSSDGSRTFMGFNPARGVAVVALADAASGGGLDDIARSILDPGEPIDRKVVPRPRLVTLPSWAIDRVLGTYQYAPDDEMTITRGATGLVVTAGMSQFLVKPTSRTRFVAPDAMDLYLEFPGPAAETAPLMVFHQDGKRWAYARVKVAADRHD
ncbi:MAG: serine hydrolase [Gammaproteobacteria bacterium]|nr:serine hydrolase [Gammaproteobacteria bacterium]